MRFSTAALSLSLGFALVGCHDNTPAPKMDKGTSSGAMASPDARQSGPMAQAVEAAPMAMATIRPAKKATKDENVTGTIAFHRAGAQVRVVADLAGFKPNSIHGIHFHESGDLSAPDLSSAGGHFNPTNMPHAGPDDAKHHAGDLGNITADGQGKVHKEWMLSGITLGSGKTDVIGKSVIIHSGADDLKSQPSGDSGGRIAGGVIEPTR